jgi:hypothetical protein
MESDKVPKDKIEAIIADILKLYKAQDTDFRRYINQRNATPVTTSSIQLSQTPSTIEMSNEDPLSLSLQPATDAASPSTADALIKSQTNASTPGGYKRTIKRRLSKRRSLRKKRHSIRRRKSSKK